MYWRWELPDKQHSTLVQGANNQKMYPDYAINVEGGSNTRRNVKIGLITLVSILILAAIAAVPTILLTRSKFRASSNSSNISSNAEELQVRDSFIVNDTLANRTSRQIISQNIHLQTNDKNHGEGEDSKYKCYAKDNEAGIDKEENRKLNSNHDDEIEHAEVIQAGHGKTQNDNSLNNYNNHGLKSNEYINKIIQNNTDLFNVLNEIASLPLGDIDSVDNIVHSGVDQVEGKFNATELSNAKLLIVFQSMLNANSKFVVKDFGRSLLEHIVRSNKGTTEYWEFLSNTSFTQNNSKYDTPHDDDEADEEQTNGMNLKPTQPSKDYQIDKLKEDAKQSISNLISKTTPISWIIVTQDNDQGYKAVASGPITLSTLQLLQLYLSESFHTENLDVMMNTLSSKIYKFVEN